MKKIGISMWALSLAASLTIFGAGFATWLHTSYLGVETKGTFEVYDVKQAEAFIDRTSTEMFEYHSLSFVDANGSVLNEGKIRVHYTVDLTSSYNAMMAAGKTWDGNLTVALSLGYRNTAIESDGLFARLDNGHDVREVTAEIEGHTGSNVSVSGTSVDVTHTFTELAASGSFSFTVTYTVRCPKDYADGGVGNFRNNFGKYLKAFEDDQTEFTTLARITDVMG